MMLRTLVFFVLLSVSTFGFPTVPIIDYIKASFHQRLQQTVMDIMQKSVAAELDGIPSELETFLDKMETLHLPKMLREIANDKQIKTRENIISKVNNYINSLKSSEYLQQTTGYIKRDDDDLLPNYLDHVYGGFG